jgi:hypothetical protein
MMRFSLLAISALLLPSFYVSGKIEGSNVNAVEFENERIRIVRLHVEGHKQFEMKVTEPELFVALTPGSCLISFPDGTHQNQTYKAGDTQWKESSAYTIENLGQEPFEVLEIQFKNASGSTSPDSGKKDNPAPVAPPSSVPVEEEAHHHMKFKNQYVCVLEVEIPPRESTQFHTHSHDNLSIRISDGTVQSQLLNQEWKAVSQQKSGSFTLTEGSNKAYTHRVKNSGTTTYHVLDVELLP